MNQTTKTALIIGGALAVLVILPLVFGLIWDGQYGGWGMMGPWMMGGYGAMGWMSIFWIVVLGLIIWAVVAATSKKEEPGQLGESALEILKKRYARGEINKEEYEEKKKDLV